ncbi:MAG: sugar ABC transporter ATP-binding protein [Burkholderiaceae bacterium]
MPSSVSSLTVAPVVLEMHAVGKDYASTVLDGVSLSLRAGEVLALTGENGAGKSTLSKILCGLVPPTRGHMTLSGQPFAPGSRRQAEALGVRMVMQELSLVPTLTVAENLLLGRLPSWGKFAGGWVRQQALRDLALKQLAKIGLTDIAPETPVAQLGIGQQQMVEIARNLQDDTQVLVLDEPTAMLTHREINHLFDQIALLKQRGVAIIYVSHRLEELKQIADTVAVLRDGRLVDVCPIASVSEQDIVQRMVGRDVQEHDGRPRRAAGPVRLVAQQLGRGDAVKGVDLALHGGEIMGLAGLVGSGRTELVRLLFGADRADRGEVRLYEQGASEPTHRKPRGWRSPMHAIRAGVGLVTEDRKSQGLLLAQSIRVNTTLSDLTPLSRWGWLLRAKETRVARRWIEALRVRCQGPEQSVGTLSGGNQQKVVFSRWLHRECNVLLLDEPTRGVDVGARADLYAELDRMTEAGKALLMVSSDLRELMAVCDRIGVMNQGRLVATYERGEWSEQQILSSAFEDPTRRTH